VVRTLFLTAVCISSLFAEDIRISKDSMWVYNSNASSKADVVIFRNNSSASIRLDSAYIKIEEMDTVNFIRLISQNKMEIAWNANWADTPFFSWSLESIGNNTYKLKKKENIPQDAIPLFFKGNNDSTQIFKLSIGNCFVCESRPYYPRYIKGSMKFYFSNGQVIVLRLYSDDLRTPVRTSLRRGSITTCLFGDSLDISSINDTCQKRKMSGGCPYNTCTVLTPDIRITSTKIYAPKGVLLLGTCLDSNCLDTLKQIPTSGYGDSADLAYISGGELFAIRTSEMNYAALYVVRTLSEMPIRQLKWIYQTDSTAVFIKVTSAQTTKREIKTGFPNLKSIVYRNNVRISWTPLSGTLKFQLFDCKGRRLHSWECDGQQGSYDAPMKTLNIAHSTHVLKILLHNEAVLTKEHRFVLP
jgi:hypothetical protein